MLSFEHCMTVLESDCVFLCQYKHTRKILVFMLGKWLWKEGFFYIGKTYERTHLSGQQEQEKTKFTVWVQWSSWVKWCSLHNARNIITEKKVCTPNQVIAYLITLLGLVPGYRLPGKGTGKNKHIDKTKHLTNSVALLPLTMTDTLSHMPQDTSHFDNPSSSD